MTYRPIKERFARFLRPFDARAGKPALRFAAALYRAPDGSIAPNQRLANAFSSSWFNWSRCR
jgi:hypothetical protein